MKPLFNHWFQIMASEILVVGVYSSNAHYYDMLCSFKIAIIAAEKYALQCKIPNSIDLYPPNKY